MAEAVPERLTGRDGARPSWLAHIGAVAMASALSLTVGLAFQGDGLLALAAPARGRARFRVSDLARAVT
jgi:hypothetical protein